MSMTALIKNGECIGIVGSTAGHDLTDVTLVDAPENPTEWRYVDGGWVPRTITLIEQVNASLEADATWDLLCSATPAEVEAWLTANVADISDARQVLKLLVFAVRKIGRFQNDF